MYKKVEVMNSRVVNSMFVQGGGKTNHWDIVGVSEIVPATVALQFFQVSSILNEIGKMTMSKCKLETVVPMFSFEFN